MKIEIFLFTFLTLTSCSNLNLENKECDKKGTTKEISNLKPEILKIPSKLLTTLDTLNLIQDIKEILGMSTENDDLVRGKILNFHRLVLNGKNEEIMFLEFEYGFTCGASWPGKCQLFFTENGRLIGRVDAEKYSFLNIERNQKPYFYTLETTQHGNGGHGLYKISHDTLENTLDGSSDYFPRTFDSDETSSVNEPFELKMNIGDFNNDKQNDISFSGKIVKYNKKYPVDFQFLYNKQTGHFSEKEDYCKKYSFIEHD